MNDKIKMFIGNEEVVCSNEFTISEEMLSASSTILNNCYPKSWELTKNYVSNFYYPEDYSKLIIGNGNYQYGDTEYSTLEVTGKNLFDFGIRNETNYGLNFVSRGSEFTFDGKKTANSNTIGKTSIGTLKAGRYTFSFNKKSGSYASLSDEFTLYAGTTKVVIISLNRDSYTNSFTINQDTEFFIQYWVNANSIYNNYVIDFQLELGNGTAYEPYNQPNLQYETNVEKEWNKLEILGNSYQETRSGKNLLKYPYYATLPTTQADVTWNNDNGKITATGTASGYSGFTLESNLPVQANTNYRFYIVGTQTNVSVDITGTGLGINIPSSSLNNAGYTFNTGNATTITINIKRQANSSVSASFYPMLVIGTDTSTDYEAYGVQPSPDYPSTIQNVGYQNLLNLYISGSGSSNGIDYTINSDKSITLNGTATSTFYLNLNLYNGYYGKFTNRKVYTSYLKGCQDKVRMVTRYQNSATVFLSTNFGEETSTQTYYGITNENCFSYLTIANGTQVNYLRVYPMIIEGTPIYSYIPYGKYGIEVKNYGKNLFDEIYENGTINTSTGANESSSTIIRTKNFQSIKPLQDYTLILPNEVTGIIIYYYNNGAYINYQQPTISNHKVSFTTRANSNQIKWRFNSNYTTLINQTMLYEGTRATEYEPYKENTQLYVLDEPLRAIGDVKDTFTIENGIMTIERNIGSVILNGSEAWTNWSNGTAYGYRLSSINNLKSIASSSTENILISNYFKKVISQDYLTSHNTEEGIATAVGNFYIRLNQSNGTITTWLSTHNTEVQYVLATPTTYTRKPVEINNSYEGVNNVTFNTGLSGRNTINYYWRNYDVLFSGIVKNSGEISLNPREPHYCSLQVLDYKTFLSESNCLDFVISDKTISQAIEMVVNAVSGYGFVVGNINISQANEIIGAYSTLNQSAYDVLQYLANISGSRWRARYVDSSTMAIDFYDPDLLPQADDILYTQQYYEDNNIVNLSFSYGTRDYRNKQIVLSDEIYGDIDYTENLYADGYQTTFLLQENIGVVKSVLVNGVAQEVITKEEKDNGVDGDFWYTPGKDTLDSKKTLSVNSEIAVVYTPLISGRQIVYNSDEVQRVATNTDTIGVIARYETRNDILSSQELNQVGQTYIDYKGKAEIILTIRTKEKDLFNIGEVAYFNAPITELQQNYMVKAKNIEYIVINGTPTLFYEYQLTGSYNNEKAINYFDNQRNKAQGNIELGKSITRNIDIENEATIIWQNLTITEVVIEPTNNNILNSPLNSPLVD